MTKTDQQIQAIDMIIDALKDEETKSLLREMRNNYAAMSHKLDEAALLTGQPLRVHLADFETPIDCELVQFGTYQILVKLLDSSPKLSRGGSQEIVIYKNAIRAIEVMEK